MAEKRSVAPISTVADSGSTSTWNTSTAGTVISRHEAETASTATAPRIRTLRIPAVTDGSGIPGLLAQFTTDGSFCMRTTMGEAAR